MATVAAVACAIVGGMWWNSAPEPTLADAASAARVIRPASAPRVAQPPLVIEDAAKLPAMPAPKPSQGLPLDSQSADPATALALHRAVLEQDPQNAAALFGVGRALLVLGRTREALGPLQQAVQLRPGDWGMTFTYGRALVAADDYPSAVNAFRRARTLAPNEPASSANLAMALLRMGDRPGAAREFAAAVALDGRDPSLRLGLAISLDAAGQDSDAASAYREYLRLTPAGPEADRINARLSYLSGGRRST
jgi:Flp pilus assembly protein TadD